MKKLICISLYLLAFTAFTLGAHPSAAQTTENPGFEKLKTLVGEWEGKAADGSPKTVSYQLMSGGTALMETLKHADEPAMVTIYTADGDRVALTHYCTANNQPRMQSAPISASREEIDFSFIDATNLASPDTPHIHHLLVTFGDDDHFTQQWAWREKGKDEIDTTSFTRKK